MGQAIRKLGAIVLGDDGLLEFEARDPAQVGEEPLVHVQSGRFRLELTKREFVDLTATVLMAARELRRLEDSDEDAG